MKEVSISVANSTSPQPVVYRYLRKGGGGGGYMPPAQYVTHEHIHD